MLDKLQAIEDRYLDLEAKISDPDVIADQSNWQKATKAHAKLEPVVTAYREYRDMCAARDEAEEILRANEDEELVEMAKEELKELKPQIEAYEERLTILLFMPEYNGCKRWIVLPGLGTLQPSEIAKFAVVLVAMRQLSLLVYSLECTCVMRKPAAGGWRLWTPTRPSWVALRK